MHPVVPDLEMLAASTPTFVVATRSLALLDTLEEVLHHFEARIQVELSVEHALQVINGPKPLSLVLLDVDLPHIELGQFLESARTESGTRRFPIVLISNKVTQEHLDLLAKGAAEDLVPAAVEPLYGRLRLEAVMRGFHQAGEPNPRQSALAHSSEIDLAMDICNRATFVSRLFRETDRVQRMNTSLSVMLFEIDDFARLNLHPGPCDELLVQLAGRIQRLLRSYDIFGRIERTEFGLGLPGCSEENAAMLAERIRLEVFSAPFVRADRRIRLSPWFGIAASNGRSPIVVLRDAKKALQLAKAAGSSSIQSTASSQHQLPRSFLASAPDHDPLSR